MKKHPMKILVMLGLIALTSACATVQAPDEDRFSDLMNKAKATLSAESELVYVVICLKKSCEYQEEFTINYDKQHPMVHSSTVERRSYIAGIERTVAPDTTTSSVITAELSLGTKLQLIPVNDCCQSDVFNLKINIVRLTDLKTAQSVIGEIQIPETQEVTVDQVVALDMGQSQILQTDDYFIGLVRT